MQHDNESKNVFNTTNTEENTMNNLRGAMRTKAQFSYNETPKLTIGVAAPIAIAPKSPQVSKLVDEGIVTFEPCVSKEGREYTRPKFDMDTLLSLPTNKQAATVEHVFGLAERVVGSNYAGNQLIKQFDWTIKSKANKLRGLLSFSVANAYKKGEHEKLSLLREKVKKLANQTEVMYEEQEALVSIIRALTGEDFSIYPFHSTIKPDQMKTVHDEDDGVGKEELDLEYDEAAEFIRGMEQADMRTHKESASSLFGDGGSVEIQPRVEKYEWIDELMNRTQAEWEEDAKYAAWTVARFTMDDVLADPKFAPTVEYLAAKEKPLAFFRKAKRKAWDALAAVESRGRRVEYLNSLSGAMDSDSAQLTIAAMQGSKNDEEVMELEAEAKELELVAHNLFDIGEMMGDAISLAKIDDEPIVLPFYENYLKFDPVKFLVDHTRLIVEHVQKKRWTYHMAKAAAKSALEQLRSPEVEVTEFTDEKTGKPVKLWHLSWAEAPVPTPKMEREEARPDVAAMLELIRSVNLVRYQYSQRHGSEDRSKQRKDLVKAFATQNKKKYVITDGRDDFLF